MFCAGLTWVGLELLDISLSNSIGYLPSREGEVGL